MPKNLRKHKKHQRDKKTKDSNKNKFAEIIKKAMNDRILGKPKKKQKKTKNYERVEAKNVKKSHNCDKCQ